jgi:hypothetical protein
MHFNSRSLVHHPKRRIVAGAHRDPMRGPLIEVGDTIVGAVLGINGL